MAEVIENRSEENAAFASAGKTIAYTKKVDFHAHFLTETYCRYLDEYLQHVLVQLPYFGKSPSHEELETLMPWAPDIQQDHKIPNSDVYTKCCLD